MEPSDEGGARVRPEHEEGFPQMDSVACAPRNMSSVVIKNIILIKLLTSQSLRTPCSSTASGMLVRVGKLHCGRLSAPRFRPSVHTSTTILQTVLIATLGYPQSPTRTIATSLLYHTHQYTLYLHDCRNIVKIRTIGSPATDSPLAAGDRPLNCVGVEMLTAPSWGRPAGHQRTCGCQSHQQPGGRCP
jgi:hypothetical protein